MGKASRTKQDSGRREKIAAQRDAERRQERRNRLLIAGSAVAVVVIIVVAFVVFKTNNKPSTTSGSSAAVPTGAAIAPVISQITSVPAATLDSVGSGGGAVTGKINTINGGTALTANGKPEMVYMGAEYCPYCAAERWSMVVALSRFGTFSGLTATHSAAKNGNGQAEVFPNTSTWTFFGSSYTSSYLTFTPVEMQTNIGDPKTGGYTTLQAPTSAQNALLTKFDAPPYVSSANAGAIPFVDFGNKYLIVGASYDPGTLAGLSWSQIGADLSNASSPVAKAVDGAANYITAAICKLTNDQPATACTSTVQGLQSQL
jgi:hypothetical protein